MPNLERQWTVADRDDLPDDGNRREVIEWSLAGVANPLVIDLVGILPLYWTTEF